MRHKSIMTPDIMTRFDNFKEEIYEDMYCVRIGKIDTFYPDKQSADIELQMKYRKNEKEVIAFPPLVDCPVLYLQGGGAYIDMPVKAGDYCLVLFHDNDIDNWWTACNVAEPNTIRKHHLSDGFALVGINCKDEPLDIDGNKVRIMCNNKELSILNATKINMIGATESFVKGDTLYNQLNTLITAIQSFTNGLNPTTLASQATTLNTACGTALGILNQIKSTKIKGE